jgi:hypothetical protein
VPLVDIVHRFCLAKASFYGQGARSGLQPSEVATPAADIKLRVVFYAIAPLFVGKSRNRG